MGRRKRRCDKDERSDDAKKRKLEKRRMVLQHMSQEDRAALREKDKLRKRVARNRLKTNLHICEKGGDVDEDEYSCGVRLSDRNILQVAKMKLSKELQYESVADEKALFCVKLNKLKWQACNNCKTKVIGFSYNCYCKSKKFVLNSELSRIGEVPPELRNLSVVEELLISKVHVVAQVYKLRGGQTGYSGHIVNFFQDVNEFCSVLPHAMSDLKGLVTVCCRTDVFHKDFKVRKNIVLRALLWLRKCNQFYRNVIVSNVNLECLPDDGFFVDYERLSSDVDSCGGSDAVDLKDVSVDIRSGVPLIKGYNVEQKIGGKLKWPHVSSDPLDEFHTPGYICQAFPTLFPYGIGDYLAVKSQQLTARVYFQFLMRFGDGRFSEHQIFPYFALNSVMRWECLTKGTIYLRKHPGLKKLNIEVLKELMNCGKVVGSDLMVYSSSIRSSREYWFARTAELEAMVDMCGLPTLFFTFSAADFHWPRLLDLLKDVAGVTEISESGKCKLVLEKPNVCSEYFFEVFEMFFHDIVIGKFGVLDYWYRYEWQARGSPHVHGVKWLSHAVDVRKLKSAFDEVKEEVASYFDKLISCWNPNVEYVDVGDHPCKLRLSDVLEEKDDIGALVNTVQRHSKCSENHCLKLNKKKQKLECRYGFPKELREESVILRNEKKEFEFEGKRNDPLVNKYNEFLLCCWRANMDISGLLSRGAFSRYCGKYASKPESKSKFLIDVMKDMLEGVNESDSIRKVLQKTFMSCLINRDYSAQEVHHLLTGKKLFSCSRMFVKLNLKQSEWKYNFSLEDNEEKELSDMGSVVLKQYKDRPACLNGVCLLDFATKFNYKNFSPYSRSAVVQVFPHLNVGQGEVEEIARQLVLLYVPWRNFDMEAVSEKCWLDMQTDARLSANMLPYYFSVSKDDEDCVSSDEEVDEKVGGITCSDQENWMELVGQHLSSVSEAEVLGLRNIDVSYDWSKHETSADNCAKLWNFLDKAKDSHYVARDHTSKLFDLNEEQSCILHILEQQLNSLQEEQVDVDVPQVVLCQGAAGTGKSCVLNCIVDKICAVRGCDRMLAMASTGAAAVPIQAVTIHSALRIPIGGHKEIPDLKGESLHSFQEKYGQVEFVVLEEFSMIGCKLLNLIDRRLRQLKNSNRKFGGVYLFMFGDVRQLPPVGDVPLYRQKIGGYGSAVVSGLMLYRSIEVVKVLKHHHRQSDVGFCKFLDKLGSCELSEADKNFICSQFERNMCAKSREKFIDSIHLFATRKSVAMYNYNTLMNMNVPVLKIVSENSSKIAAACSEEQACGLLFEVYLCIGCRVMLRCNLWTEVGLVNGATGHVHDIVFDEVDSKPSVVLVKFANYKGIALANGCVPVKRLLRSWYVNDVYCTRYQFPLSVAYGITIHKSQGLTLEKVVLHIDSKEHVAGLFYVAMSRVKHLEDIMIVGEVENSPLFKMSKSLYIDKAAAEKTLILKSL